MSLEWKLRASYEILTMPVMAQVAESAGNGALTAYERHAAAAAFIMRCERKLIPLHMAYVRLQFGRDAVNMGLLVEYLAGCLGTGIHHRRTIEKILRAYCGEKIGLREIRKSMACGMLKAVTCRNRAYDEMDRLHTGAMEALAGMR